MCCNVCGKQFMMKDGLLMEDALEVRKQWGYFSKKDTQIHSFALCEECYDSWIKSFLVPPSVSEATEI